MVKFNNNVEKTFIQKYVNLVQHLILKVYIYDIIINRVVDNSKQINLEKDMIKMKKGLKRITASISAAVLCALPLANSFTASATASENARYTYRKVFAVRYTNKNIDRLVFGLSCKTSGTDAPVADQIAEGSLINSGSGTRGLHNAGGTFYPKYRNSNGGKVSIHVYCDSPSEYKEVSSFKYAYNPNGKDVSSAVTALPTFLVGDFNEDNVIDDKDHQIINEAVRVMTKSKAEYEFSYFSNVTLKVDGVSKSYPRYFFDINDDGFISVEDQNMFVRYISNINNTNSKDYRFEK